MYCAVFGPTGFYNVSFLFCHENFVNQNLQFKGIFRHVDMFYFISTWLYFFEPVYLLWSGLQTENRIFSWSWLEDCGKSCPALNLSITKCVFFQSSKWIKILDAKWLKHSFRPVSHNFFIFHLMRCYFFLMIQELILKGKQATYAKPSFVRSCGWWFCHFVPFWWAKITHTCKVCRLMKFFSFGQPARLVRFEWLVTSSNFKTLFFRNSRSS